MAEKRLDHRVPNWILSRFINRLRLAAGGPVSIEEMIEALWGDALDGGPLTAPRYIHLLCYILRKQGFPIKTNCGRGYSYRPTFHEAPPSTYVDYVLFTDYEAPPIALAAE